jgi:hypothetical protein
MTKKKPAIDVKRASTGQWVTKGVLERRTASTKFVEYAERIARDESKSRGVAQRAGIFTGTGRLTSHYKK